MHELLEEGPIDREILVQKMMKRIPPERGARAYDARHRQQANCDLSRRVELGKRGIIYHAIYDSCQNGGIIQHNGIVRLSRG